MQFDFQIEKPKPKRSLLPLLTVLFLISYGLMVMLIVEQGNTIASQRWLIKELFVDSSELTSLKSKAIEQHKAEAQTRAQARSKSNSQAPSTQVPAPEAKENAARVRKDTHQRPPKPASDETDARRNVVAI